MPSLKVVAQQGWTRRQTNAVLLRSWATSQHETHDRIAALGPPPERPELFASWLRNVGARARLMDARAAAYERGDARAHRRIDQRIYALKAQANDMGQHFGLRICTSNGPQASS